jgi:predicted nucleotidyltransferase component of viral defense system
VYGHRRFSRDIDATRHEPPKHKLDSSAIAESMRRASAEPILNIDPQLPATDSGRSLDFNAVRFRTPTHEGVIAVEISYREEAAEPTTAVIGPPYYEEFEIPVLTAEESAAEKLRTLIQRRRPTDLSDMAMLIAGQGLDLAHTRELAIRKFEIVSQGDRSTRIQRNIEALVVCLANS